MNICQGCAVEGHGSGECAEREAPVCARTCTCRHGSPESDPAPYWTAVNSAAVSPEGASA